MTNVPLFSTICLKLLISPYQPWSLSIIQLQNQSEQANDGMKNTLTTLHNNQQLQQALSQSITEILSAIEQLNQINQSVAQSSQQQQAITTQTNENLATLLQLIDQNVADIHQSAKVSEALQSLSNSQSLQLEHFKL